MRVNVVPDMSPVVAALCRMYGKSVGDGWREIFIPVEVIANLSPTGELQRVPENPTEPGWRIRYRNNYTIEGVVVSKEVVEPEPPAPVLPEPTSE